MNDMSQVIVPKSDQINADDLLGRTMTITITDVAIRGGQEQPVSMRFKDSDKVYRPCKTMCRVLVKGWGLDAKQYVGKSLTLYCDPTVTWGKLAVGGIRISHMSDIDDDFVMPLAISKSVKKPYPIEKLDMGKQQQRQPDPNAAEKWADDHIAFVVGAASTERLAAVQESGKKAMAKLQASEPALHDRVSAAYAKRLDELSPVDADDDAVDPFGDGRADDEHGDQFDGADDSDPS